MRSASQCSDVRSFDLGKFFFDDHPEINRNRSEVITNNNYWLLLLMKYYNEVYDFVVTGFNEINPSEISLKSFEKALDEKLLFFQECLNIAEEKRIRSVDLILRPLEEKLLPPNITLENIWDIYKDSNYKSRIKIEGVDYFLHIKELAKYQTDNSANILMSLYFDQSIKINRSLVERNINQNQIQLLTCLKGNLPQIEFSSLSHTISEYSKLLQSFEKPYIASEISDLDARATLGLIENSLSSSGLRFHNLIDKTCLSNLKNFSEYIFESSLYKPKFLIPREEFELRRLVTSFYPYNIYSHPNLYNLFEKEKIVYISLANYAPLCLPKEVFRFDASDSTIGILDHAIILIARKLSYEKNKLGPYRQCQRADLTFSEYEYNLNKILESVNITCEDGSIPKEHNVEPQLNTNQILPTEKDIFSEVIKTNIAIEAIAISLRTVAELATNHTGVDDNYQTTFASLIENASRLVAINFFCGNSAMLNSLALSGAVSSAKIAETSFKKSGYTPPSQLFHKAMENLIDNFIGQERRESIFAIASKTYSSVPTLCITALKQGAFVLAIHCIATGISEYRSDGKDEKKAEELTIEQKILAGVFTSIFSGTFRAICSKLTQKEQLNIPSTSGQITQPELIFSRRTDALNQMV